MSRANDQLWLGLSILCCSLFAQPTWAQTISAAPVLQPEGAGMATVLLTLSGGASFPVSVSVATRDGDEFDGALAGTDYTALSSTVSFAANGTMPVAIAFQDDFDNEDDESFTLELSNPVNATLSQSSVPIMLQNDDGSNCVWTGQSSLNPTDWTDPINWTNCGGGTPFSSDAAIFDATAVSSLAVASGDLLLGRLVMRAGNPATLDLAGNLLIVSSSLRWEAGTLRNGALRLDSSAKLVATFASPAARVLNGVMVDNQGTIKIATRQNSAPLRVGDLQLSNGAQIDNGGSIIFDNQDSAAAIFRTVDCSIACASTGINNSSAGTINAIGGGWSGLGIGIERVDSSGTVRVETASRLTFAGAGAEHGSTEIIDGVLEYGFAPTPTAVRTIDSMTANFLSGGGTLAVSARLDVLGTGLTLPVAVALAPSGSITGESIVFANSLLWAGQISSMSDASVTLQQMSTVVGPDAKLLGRPLLNLGTLTLDDAVLALDGNAMITNQVLAEMGGPMGSFMTCAGASDCGSIINQGTWRITNSFAFDPGLSYDEQGNLVVEFGTLSMTPLVTWTNPQIDVDQSATLDLQGADLLLNAGSLRGAGRLVGNVVQTGGVVQANAIGGQKLGVPDSASGATSLQIIGNYTQNVGGLLRTVLGGGPCIPSSVNVTGAVALNGTLAVVVNPPCIPMPPATFPFLSYGSNPANTMFADATGVPAGYVRDVGATAAQLRPAGGNTCTRLGGGNWSDTNWSCTPTPGVPGPADNVIVDIAAASVTLDVPGISVAGVDFRSGTIGGPNSATVTAQFLWSGGTLAGLSGSEWVLAPGSLSTLNGAAKTLSGRALINRGTLNWSAGDLTLATTGVELRNDSVVQIDVASGNLRLATDGAPGQFFHNTFGAGRSVVKRLAGRFEMDDRIEFRNGNQVAVNAGEAVFAGPGAADPGPYQVSNGATLSFNLRSPQVRDISGPVGGSGRLRKTGGGEVRYVNSLSGGIEVLDGRLRLTPGGEPPASLQIAGAAAELQLVAPLVTGQFTLSSGRLTGAALDVITSLAWSGGEMIGPAQTRLVAAGSATLSGGQKVLRNRPLRLAGNATWTAGLIELADGSTIDIPAGGLLTANPGAMVEQVFASGTGTPQIILNGTINKVGPNRAGLDVTVPISGAGRIGVDAGSFYVRGPSNLSGSHSVSGTAELEFSFSNHSFTASSQLTGDGTLRFGDAASPAVSVNAVGGMYAHTGSLVIDRAELNLLGSTGSISALTLLHPQAVLDGTTDFSVTDSFDWRAGTIRGMPASVMTLGNSLSAALTTTAAKNLDGRSLVVQDSLRHFAGSLILSNGADLSVDGTVDYQNAATVVVQGAAGSALTINGSVNLGNIGAVEWRGMTLQHNGFSELRNGSLAIDAPLAQSASAELSVLGGILRSTSPAAVVINGGLLSGNGLIDGSLVMAGIIAPGSKFDSTQALSIAGDLDQSGATFEVDVDGAAAGQYDQLLVGGQVTPGAVEPGGGGLNAGQSVDFVRHSSRPLDYITFTGAQAGVYQFNNALTTETRLVLQGPTLQVDTAMDDAALTACTAAPNDCSLRGAIQRSNTDSGAGLIQFQIPGTGVQTIALNCVNGELPTITDEVVIDGLSQAGAIANTLTPGMPGLGGNLQIVVFANNCAGVLRGLNADLNGPGDVTVRGLVLQGFATALASDRLSTLPAIQSVVLESNNFGADAAGQTIVPGTAVAVKVSPQTRLQLGGALPGTSNLLIGATIAAVQINNSAVAGHVIAGNLFGLAQDGSTQRGNLRGLDLTLGSGSDVAVAGNVLAASTEEAIRLVCNSCNNSSLVANKLGFSNDGALAPRPNGSITGATVSLSGTPFPGQIINFGQLGGGNLLGNSRGVAVKINGQSIAVRGNLMRDNVGLGIDLLPAGRTINDPGDADVGSNRLQNTPTISSFAFDSATRTATLDYLQSSAVGVGAGFAVYPITVDFYDAEASSGANLLHSVTLPAAAAQVVQNTAFVVPAGIPFTADSAIVAVATDSLGNSSEFSFHPLSLVAATVSPSTSGSPILVSLSATSLFTPQGLVDVSINTVPPATCSAMLAPSATPGQSDGSCSLMPPPAASGAFSVSSTYRAAGQAFADGMTGGDVTVVRPHTIGVVAVATTTTIAAVSPVSVAAGDPYTVTATVAASPVSPTAGTIVISAVGFADTCTITLPATGCTVPGALTGSPGLRQLVATYSGSIGFSGSSSAAFPYQVRSPVAMSLISAIPAVTVGEYFSLTVQVASPQLAIAPTGTVTVVTQPVGAAVSCTLAAIASGISQATCSNVFSPIAAAKLLSIQYQGDTLHLPSVVSPAPVLQVSRADTRVRIVDDSPDPSAPGAPVRVRVVVDVLPPASVPPVLDGQVDVRLGNAQCLIAYPAATDCTLTPAGLGNTPITARFGADPNTNASAIATEPHLVSTAQEADLSVSKSNGVGTLPGGASTTYQIVVRNAGPLGTTALLRDAIPVGLSNFRWTCVATAGSTCPASGSGALAENLALAAGGSATLTLTADVQAAPEIVVTQEAIVEPSPQVPDPNLGNNSARDIDTIGLFRDGFEAP